MKLRSTTSLGVAMLSGLALTAVQADDLSWRPIRVPVPPAAATAPAPSSPAVTLGRPVAVSLGRPVPLAEPPVPDNSGIEVQPVSYSAPRIVARAQAPDVVPPPGGGGAIPPPPPPPGTDLYNSGAVTPATNNGNAWQQGWGHFKESFNRRCGQPFQSDHAGDFDQFASPISSPFLTEDPRALTEIRPIFIYQSIPDDNGTTRGGSIEYFGLQARLALTERWSIVMNKLGYIAIQPDNTQTIGDESGLSELWIGPKYTFYRDETHNTAAAVGLTFQIPLGDRKVVQDTGDLSLSPYVSFAKSFGRLPQGFGNFNLMGTAGYSFSTDNQRSDYFYGNIHLDFDIAGQHRLYPMIEFNYTRYTNKGGARNLTFEGVDLFNFGSRLLDDRNYLTMALGARYKVGGRENIQFGGAVEFPLLSNRDLNDFRFTFDVIFRY